VISNIFILDKSLKTKLVLTVNGQNTFFKDIYNLNLSTGTESYEFSTNAEDIDESDYIMFHYKDQYKLFQIIEIEQEHSEGKIITSVYGECASLELINGAVRPLAGTVEMNAIDFINMVLEGSEWQIHKYSKSLKDKKIPVKIDKTTQRWQLIQDYMGSFGYEITTNVKYANGFVKAKYIDVYAEGDLGNRTYKRFEYGRNVKGITKKKDIYDFCTALILDTKQDVKDAEYNIGGYTKAKGDDVIYATNENKKYNAGRQYIYGVYEDNDSETPGDVVEKAVAELKKRAVPHFDYECDTALTYKEYEDINIGDTVYVIDHSFTPMVTLEARVGELEISFTDRNNCKCNLSNYKEIKSKINVKLTAGINDIIKTYFPLDGDKIAQDSLGPGHIKEATYDKIKVDIVQAEIGVFKELYTEELIAETGYIGQLYTAYMEADEAIIGKLEAEYATIENLTATNAYIQNLEAEKIDVNIANIGTLNADLAKIDTLINGNLTSDNIKSFHITADKVTMADGFIQNAMIAGLDAGKINAGILNTNNVVIGSDTGGITLAKETMQFKDENGKVRIQIGRDTNNNFTFALYDSTGKGQLINQDGIQSSDAISDGLIRDGHIDTNANISGAKIDMSSLFTEMNDSTETLKATKIYLDDKKQTLDVSFNTLSTTVDGISGGRNYQTDSDFSKDVLAKWPSYYNSTNTISTSSNFAGDNILKNVADIAKRVEADPEGKARYGRFHAPAITLEKNTEYTLSCWVYIDGNIKEASASIYTVYDDDTSPVSKGATNKITTTKSWQKIERTFTTDNTTNKYQVRFYNRFADGATTGTSTVFIYHPTISKGTKALDWTPAIEDLDGRITANTTQISVNQGEISTLVSESEVIKKSVDDLGNATTTLSNSYSELKQDVDGFKTTVADTYSTKDETEGVITLVNDSVSAIEQNASSISASITEVQASLDDVSGELTTLSKKVSTTMTSDEVKLEIESQLSGVSVDNVTTSTGYTFDSTGLTISKTSSDVSTQITEDGMKVYKGSNTVLTANNAGVDAKNLHATTYLIVGNNSRFEDYGSNRTGCYYIK
jgi:phage minor structural protein